MNQKTREKKLKDGVGLGTISTPLSFPILSPSLYLMSSGRSHLELVGYVVDTGSACRSPGLAATPKVNGMAGGHQLPWRRRSTWCFSSTGGGWLKSKLGDLYAEMN